MQAQKAAQQLLTEEARTEKENANALKAHAQAINAVDKAQNQLNKTMTAGVGIANNMGMYDREQEQCLCFQFQRS